MHGVAQIFISLCNLPTPHLLAFKTQTMPVLPKGSPGKKFKLPTRKALCMTTNMSAEKERWCPPLLSNTSSSLPIFSLSSPPPPQEQGHITLSNIPMNCKRPQIAMSPFLPTEWSMARGSRSCGGQSHHRHWATPTARPTERPFRLRECSFPE